VYIIDFGSFNFKVARTLIKKDKAIPLHTIFIYFHGKPREAVQPPWDGGWIFSKDAKGRPWMTVACQGLGASVWYPCKDHLSDEPDLGAMIQVRVPDSLVAVANGRLFAKDDQKDGTMLYTWKVENPINNYNIVPYIGKYVHYTDNFIGETEKNLSLDYWVLDYNLEKAKKQFGRDVKPMLKAFEYWFGPYPFYEDGYKLVEVPYLGMEHQSSVTYGNKFRKGYLGKDLSSSGWGLKWDFIIVHESAHEWWANSITYKDIADMWIHESFAHYAESLFLDYHYGRKAANEYVMGTRKKVVNDIPIIGPYNVNKEGSKDMYYKGGSMLHSLRMWLNDDTLWRKVLRGLQKEYYHQTVSTHQIEGYMAKATGKNLDPFFDQYLRDTRIPVLEFQKSKKTIKYRYTNIVDGFNMPLAVNIDKGEQMWIQPTAEWQTYKQKATIKSFEVDPNFYVDVKETK
jgi:aminopeptidase N